MEVICAACNEPIGTNRKLKCICCAAHYQPICVNAGSSNINKLRNWQCPLCKANVPKSGNINTPVRSSTTPEVSSMLANTSTRAQKRMALSSPNGTEREDYEQLERDSVASELRLLRMDIADIKSGLFAITEGISKCNSRLDSFESRIKVLEERESNSDIPLFQNTIRELEVQLGELSQAPLTNELEILGINETSNENLVHIVMVTVTKVGFNLPENDIDWVVRAGGKHNMNKKDSNSTAPRPIIVRLTRKARRDEFLKAAKLRRHMVITTADLDLLGPPRNVYINEHLPKSNRLLFRNARLRAKELGFRYCWVNNGRIHIRRQEGSQAIPIKTASGLDRLQHRDVAQHVDRTPQQLEH